MVVHLVGQRFRTNRTGRLRVGDGKGGLLDFGQGGTKVKASRDITLGCQ